jgi:sugar lactone lactonase YvrE
MDGTGTAAWFFNPTAITTNGTHLYVADTSNNKIRKIEIATGVVTSFAGSGTAGALDGTGTAATFWQPGGIATDGTNLYVTENGNNRVRKIVIATGVVSTLAGSTIGTLDGTGTAAQFSRPIGITTDGTNLYVVDSSSFKIRKIVIDTGVVTTFAGSGSAGAVDAVGTAATFTYPAGITTDGTNLYVADSLSNRIRKIVISTRAVTTLAGSATSGSDDGAGSAAKFFKPAGVATDGTNVYVGDTGNHKIRKIVIATGEVSTIAGTGSIGAADGTGSAASFYNPNGMTTDGKTLYVVDSTNTKIRKID